MMFLIERLEKYILDECPKIPLSGNRAVSEEEIRARIGQLREAVPVEVARAQQVLEQQAALLAQARQEAEQLLVQARADIKQQAADHHIVQEAKQQATVLRQRTAREVEVLRHEADEYVFNSLSHLQEELTRLLHVVENGLQKLEVERERQFRG